MRTFNPLLDPDRTRHSRGIVRGETKFLRLAATLALLLGAAPSPRRRPRPLNLPQRQNSRSTQAGKLLSPASLAMTTTSGATRWYGLGFIVNPGESWGHGGTSYGMHVAAHHYPKIDTTFVCIAARDMACNRLIYAWYLRTFGPED